MTARRLSPKKDILRELFLRSGNECAHPACDAVLIDADGTMVGDIAHIEAAEENGPRFNSNMNNEERRSYDNLMLLCASHHRQVDGKNSRLSVSQLVQMKANHVKRFTEIENTLKKRFTDQLYDITDDIVSTKPSTLSSFIAQSAGELENDDCKTVIIEIGAYVDLLSKVPDEHRKFILLILKRIEKRDSWSGENPSLSCNDIQAALNYSQTKIKQLSKGLEEYGVGHLYNPNDTWEVFIKNPSDYLCWAEVVEFCNNTKISLECFVENVEFGRLD